MTRGGKTGASSYGSMDNITMSYAGNKLIGANDAVSGIMGNYQFQEAMVSTVVEGNTSTHEYLYDVNGNMIQDKNKGITVVYNYLNLPIQVNFGATKRIDWTYTATGAKLQKKVYTNGNLTLTQDYVSGFVYKNGSLDFFSTETGRVKNQSGTLKYQYTLTDHLGNTRVMFGDADNNGVAEVLEESHYYAFGMRIEGLGSISDNKFLYNGKELTEDHGLNWYEYGWRMYDAQIGRWHVVDPVDEFYSPYTYVANNPMRWTDPDGRNVDFNKKEDAEAARDALNSLHDGMNLSVREITEKKSILFGLIEWEVTKYRLSTENSDFDFAQNKYTMGLYDVINTQDFVFNIEIVPDDYRGFGDPITIYNKGGGKASSFEGGSNILVSKNNRVGDPFGVVLMHELVGHGHPVGGNNAHDVNRFYNSRFGISRDYGYRHDGYHSGIGWKQNQINLFKMPQKQ